MPFIPYVLGTDLEFEKCLPDILVQEGGYSDDAHDPGGPTDFGIIQREYDMDRRSWGLPTQPIRNISADEYRTIYYVKYWLPYCPKLYPGMDLQFFNMSVNGGPHRAIENLQRALKIESDGQWGPRIESAVLAVKASHPQALIDAYRAVNDNFYRALPTFRYFGKDWLRRDAEIDAQADTLDKALDDFTNNPPKPIMKDETT